MKVLKISAMVLVLVTSSALLSQDKDEKVKAEEKKIYSQTEFDAALQNKLDKLLKKNGQDRLIEFSNELLKKEKHLKEREKMIKDREEILANNENSLRERVAQVSARQNKILGCIDKNDEDAKQRINHIVSVISNMKPVQAAQVLSTQESEISVRILALLDAVKAAKIFNLMKKEISAQLQRQYLNMKR